MKIQYDITEVVTYRRELEVPDGATDDDILSLTKADWIENGNPISDFIEVHDRETDGWEVLT